MLRVAGGRLAGLGDGDYLKLLEQVEDSESKERIPPPHEGRSWPFRNGPLRDYLVKLTSRFEPNHFSLT